MILKQVIQLNQELQALLQEKITFKDKYEVIKARKAITPHIESFEKVQKEMFKEYQQYKIVKDIPEELLPKYKEMTKELEELLETKDEEVVIDNLTFSMFADIQSKVPYEIIFKVINHED